MRQERDLVLSVPEVSCEHCVNTINGGLGKLSGVQAVKTDIPTKTVNLRIDPSKISQQQIESALDELGYTVAHA